MVNENKKLGSKRFYAACAAMQGLWVAAYSSEWMNKGFMKAASVNCENLAEYIAKQAFIAADELLKQENNENETER